MVTAHKSSCKQCGECCKKEVCLIGKVFMGTTKTPCPALEKLNGKYWCGLIVKTEKYIFPSLKLSPHQQNGIREHLMMIFNFGEGCDLEDWRITRRSKPIKQMSG